MTTKGSDEILDKTAAILAPNSERGDAAPTDLAGRFVADSLSAQLREDTAPILLSVMEELANVKIGADFLRCTEGTLQRLLPHEVTFSAIGITTAQGPRAVFFLAHEYPWEFLVEIQGPNGEICCNLLDRWLLTGEPQLFDIDRDAHQVNKKWLAAFRKYDFRRFINHGVRARSRDGMTTYFSFSRIPGPLKPEYSDVMKLIAPHVHVALLRVFSVSQAEKAPHRAIAPENPLSERQRDILLWIQKGKTNWEIAKILGFTEKAVKYHLGQIFQKLQVANRTQAVVKAVTMKII